MELIFQEKIYTHVCNEKLIKHFVKNWREFYIVTYHTMEKSHAYTWNVISWSVGGVYLSMQIVFLRKH